MSAMYFNRYGTIEDIPLMDVLIERQAQDAKWGEQNHKPLKWLAILMEEVGELSEAILLREGIREEAVQVAAVALAIVECCDRNGWVREVPDE